MPSPGTSPMAPATSKPSDQTSNINGGMVEDINMADSTTRDEAILEDDSMPLLPSTVAPPMASPMHSPATPDVTTEAQVDENVEFSSTSMHDAPDLTPLQALPNSQTMEQHSVEQAQAQSQAEIEPFREGASSEPGSHFVAESGPAHLQGTTTPAGPRPFAISQPFEAVPVQMANNEQGSAARIYINTRITPVLLAGMKWVARNEPDKPLKWLSEYLAKRSADVEGI